MSLNDNDELDFHKFFDLPHCNRSYNFSHLLLSKGSLWYTGGEAKDVIQEILDT